MLSDPPLAAGGKRNKTGRIKEPDLKPKLRHGCDTDADCETELKTDRSTRGPSPEMKDRLLKAPATLDSRVEYDSRLLSSTMLDSRVE